MNEPLLDYDVVHKKQEAILYHRQLQKQDVDHRHRIRQALISDVAHKEAELRLLQASAAPTCADIANVLEDLEDLQRALFQLITNDSIADDHWKRHFQLPQFQLSYTERKFIRCFSPTTAIQEVPRRTLSPVELSHSRTERSKLSHHTAEPLPPRSSSSLSLGNGVALRLPVPKRAKLPSLSRIFRVPENGSHGRKHQKLFSPPAVTSKKVSKEVLTSTPIASLDSVKKLNHQGLFALQRNHFKEAEAHFLEALSIIESQEGGVEKESQIVDSVRRDFASLHAVTLCNLSNLSRSCKNFKKASNELSQCIALETKIFGTPTPSSSLNMSALQLELGNVEEATRMARELLGNLLMSGENERHGRLRRKHLVSICEKHLATCEAFAQQPQTEELDFFNSQMNMTLTMFNSSWNTSPNATLRLDDNGAEEIRAILCVEENIETQLQPTLTTGETQQVKVDATKSNHPVAHVNVAKTETSSALPADIQKTVEKEVKLVEEAAQPIPVENPAITGDDKKENPQLGDSRNEGENGVEGIAADPVVENDDQFAE